jgi:hypothetical protein
MIAGCGASHPKPTPNKTSGTTSVLSQKSFNDGYAEGKTIAVANVNVNERQANCEVVGLQDMPTGDIKSDWLSGCMLGSMLANWPTDPKTPRIAAEARGVFACPAKGLLSPWRSWAQTDRRAGRTARARRLAGALASTRTPLDGRDRRWSRDRARRLGGEPRPDTALRPRRYKRQWPACTFGTSRASRLQG